jgi:tryptophanyl-tRNA synthetase
MRAKYETLIAQPVEIEATLREGADKARKIATPLLRELRHAVGLRDLRDAGPAPTATARAKPALPQFKQYREADGRFYFKLAGGDGALLLQSDGFANPKDAGAWIARFRREGAACAGDALAVARLAEGIDRAALDAALEALRAAESVDA